MMMPLIRIKLQIASLVKEMLDQLPSEVWTSTTTTFLDPAMGGGQFLIEIERRLAAAGHSDDNISTRVFGCERNQLRLNYSKMFTKLRTNNLLVNDGLSHDWGDMKFDVIVGNPPYQDATGNPLYYKIHNVCVNQLLAPNGYIIMITPDAMAVGLELGKIKGRHSVSKISLIKVNMASSIKRDHFPNIGISNFCWYVGQNCQHHNTQYTIVSDSGEFVGRINPLKPMIQSPLINSVLNKCFSYNSNSYNGSWNTAGVTATKNTRGKHSVVTNIDENNQLVTYKVSFKTAHRLHGHPKLFVSGFGNRAAVAYDHKLVAAVEKTVYTVPTNSDTESENLLGLLDCKLQRFFSHVVQARGPYLNFLRDFKGVPLDRAWNDMDLYHHFGLAPEEIKLIESTVTNL
jgi:hypothetical protein